MGTAESIQLVDKLVEAKIPKSTATELVDRIDRGNLELDNPKWINLENDVQDLKNDVQDLKNDVQDLKNNVQDLKSGVQVLENDVQVVKNDVQDLKSDVQVLKNDVRWLKWAIALGFSALVALMFGIVGIVTYLHNDMKAEIHSVRTEMKAEIQSVRTDINQLSAKIDQILLQRR